MSKCDFAACFTIPVYDRWNSVYACLFIPLVLFILLLSLSCQAFAIECDQNLKRTNTATGYVARGNRCEGFYSTRKVAGQFGLIGYIKGRLQFNEQANDVLEISLPEALRPHYANVSVRAQPFSPMTYYRMDATFNTQQSLQWPSADVLKPEQLNDEKIGVYGYVELQGKDNQKDTTVYLPLIIKSTSHPHIADQDLRLFFSTFVDINYLLEQWICGGIHLPDKAHRKIYHSGKPIVIFPPANQSGLCLLKLTGVVKQKDVSGVSNLVETVDYIQLDK